MTRLKINANALLVSIGIVCGFIICVIIMSVLNDIMTFSTYVQTFTPLFTALLSLASLFILLTSLEEGRKDRNIMIEEAEKDRKNSMRIVEKEIQFNRLREKLSFYSKLSAIIGKGEATHHFNRYVADIPLSLNYEMHANDELIKMFRTYYSKVRRKIGGQPTEADDMLCLAIKENVKKHYEDLMEEYRVLTT